MMILDAHAHLGYDVVFDEESTEEELLHWHTRCGISSAIVQPFITRPYIDDIRASHDRIAAFCRSHPGRRARASPSRTLRRLRTWRNAIAAYPSYWRTRARTSSSRRHCSWPSLGNAASEESGAMT